MTVSCFNSLAFSRFRRETSARIDSISRRDLEELSTTLTYAKYAPINRAKTGKTKTGFADRRLDLRLIRTNDQRICSLPGSIATEWSWPLALIRDGLQLD